MMTDTEIVVYLNKHIGDTVHFYHRVVGDSTGKILSINTKGRSFNCVLAGYTHATIVSIDDITEFNFRVNGS